MNLNWFKNNKAKLCALSLVGTVIVSVTGCGSEEIDNSSMEMETTVLNEGKMFSSAISELEVTTEEVVEKKEEQTFLEKIVPDAYLRNDFVNYLNGYTYDPERNADALGYVITYLGDYAISNKGKFFRLSNYIESSRTAHQLDLIEEKMIKICKSKDKGELNKNYNSLEKLLESLNKEDKQMVIGDSARRRYKEIYAPVAMVKAASLGDVNLVEEIDKYTRDAKVNYTNNGTDDNVYNDVNSTVDEEIGYCGITR